MPKLIDFRNLSQFDPTAVSGSGRNVGKAVYWKLYAIENFYRIIIHSVLSVQINSNWWPIATDTTIRRKARNFKRRYINRPWHTMPGSHFIYFIDLYDLNEITRVNSHLFVSLIPDIDQWILKIETLRLPRNVVAHMNFPNRIDRQRIGTIYEDFKALIAFIQQRTRVVLQIP